MLPGPAGDLPYRLYRPAVPVEGPHPMVVYFHGGGWVLGDLDSDDPLCRDLCARSGAVVVSVNYRHAPEARFPAAADDAFAALRWVAANAADLGGIPGQLAVAGWSAGGNIATVACQLARDAGGPDVCGQLLIHPVVDSDLTRPSYVDNGDGYLLTSALMGWFWDHYADPADRHDPAARPAARQPGRPAAGLHRHRRLRSAARRGPRLRRHALRPPGSGRHVRARGHTHTSLTMVGVVISGAPVRAELAQALTGFFPGPAEA